MIAQVQISAETNLMIVLPLLLRISVVLLSQDQQPQAYQECVAIS
jgi:hypothetical protein